MSRHKFTSRLLFALALASCVVLAAAAEPPQERKAEGESEKTEGHRFEPFKPEAVTSNGSVTIGGRAIELSGHRRHPDRSPARLGRCAARSRQDTGGAGPRKAARPTRPPKRPCSMSPTSRAGEGPRPVTFFYNGGPGSSTMWLHMGAFGPRRIVTSTDAHTPAAPYSLVNNAYSLLDATDLVFIDAPGTGFSRIAGKDKEKAFFGVDPDAYAFSEFVTQFLIEVRPLELAQVSVRRELRHAALGGGGQPARVGALDRLQRRHSALADPQLRPEPGPAHRQPRRRSALPDRAANLCRHRVVSPQAARSSTRASRRCSPRWSSSPWATTRVRWRLAPS